jgi:hypothetical protein
MLQLINLPVIQIPYAIIYNSWGVDFLLIIAWKAISFNELWSSDAYV